MSDVLLVPGTLCSPALWSDLQAPKLRWHERARVHTPAWQQLPASDSLSQSAAALLETAPPHFALLGFSLGAILAFEILRQAPERVSKVALLSANPKPASPAQIATWRQLALHLRQTESSEAELGTVASGFADALYPQHPQYATLRQRVITMAEDVGVPVFLRQLRWLETRPDSRPSLAMLRRRPVLLAVGRHDPLTPLALHQEMLELIPHAKLAVLEHCGHYSPLEQAPALDPWLETWLQS